MTKAKPTITTLRGILKLSQPKFARVLGYSSPTIQAIEYGKLKLSEKLAGEIALKTGVSLDWLLLRQTTKPPLNRDGNPYTFEFFEKWQAALRMPKVSSLSMAHLNYHLGKHVSNLCALLLSAYEDNRIDLCIYKLDRAMDALAEEFDLSTSVLPASNYAHQWTSQNREDALGKILSSFYDGLEKTRNKKAKPPLRVSGSE